MMRTILFDVDGVVLHSMFHPDPNRCRRWDQHMQEDIGISNEMMQEFFNQRFPSIVRGKTSLITELAEFLPTIGYTDSPLTFLNYWFKHDGHLNLKLIKAIKQLAKFNNIHLYLATNQEHLRAYYLWNELGLKHVFDDMFYAARLGEAKPDDAYFLSVDKLIGEQELPPLFFDDTKRIVDAANSHGWEACLFDVTENFTSHPWVAERLNG